MRIAMIVPMGKLAMVGMAQNNQVHRAQGLNFFSPQPVARRRAV